MKPNRFLWLWILLIGVAACVAQIGSESLTRFREWRYPLFTDSNTRVVWTQVDNISGAGRWQEIPFQFADLFISNSITAGILYITTNANLNTAWVTNGVVYQAEETSYYIGPMGGSSSLFVTNVSSGVQMSFAGTVVNIYKPAWMHSAIITNGIVVGAAQTNDPIIINNAGTNVLLIQTNGSIVIGDGPGFAAIRRMAATNTAIYFDVNGINMTIAGTLRARIRTSGLQVNGPVYFGTTADDTLLERSAAGVSRLQSLEITNNLSALNVTVTNNIGFQVGTVAGVGGANTNFTIQAANDESIIYVNAGTTNVNIVAIMGYSSTIAYRGTVILTNRTATARTLSLGATTNNWISLQQFDGITAPFTVTNSLAGRLDWEILGTNVQYSYKPMALPSN